MKGDQGQRPTACFIPCWINCNEVTGLFYYLKKGINEDNKMINEKKLVQDAAELNELLFKEFWRLYPRKEGKKPCWDKWCKIDTETQRKIIEHVRERATTDIKWLKGYAPMPATFFNQQRWDDEYEVDAGGGKTKIAGNEKRQVKPQVICSKCRGDTRSQRHADICEAGVPYFDLKIKGEPFVL